MATHLTDHAPTCTAPGTLRPGRYAAIDIGTVTCRMLVADIDEAGALHELRREYAITNLGEGVDASGVLRPEAMQRRRHRHCTGHPRHPAGRGQCYFAGD